MTPTVFSEDANGDFDTLSYVDVEFFKSLPHLDLASRETHGQVYDFGSDITYGLVPNMLHSDSKTIVKMWISFQKKIVKKLKTFFIFFYFLIQFERQQKVRINILTFLE